MHALLSILYMPVCTMPNHYIVACPLKAGIAQTEQTSVTRLRHSKQWGNNGIPHAMPRNQRKYRWERCSLWDRVDSYVMQQKRNCWKRCFLSGPSRGYITRTRETSWELRAGGWQLEAAAERYQPARTGAVEHGSRGRCIVGSRYQATWLSTLVCLW
jgi:hypothetical protein